MPGHCHPQISTPILFKHGLIEINYHRTGSELSQQVFGSIAIIVRHALYTNIKRDRQCDQLHPKREIEVLAGKARERKQEIRGILPVYLFMLPCMPVLLLATYVLNTI